MELYLDDRKTDAGCAPDASLGQLLADIKGRLDADGRIIVGVTCDGIDVCGDDFVEALKKPVAEYTRVDMHSAEPRELVREALNMAEQLLDATRGATGQIVDEIACGNVKEALPKLGECCRVWAQTNEGVCNAAAMLQIDVEKFCVGSQPLKDVLSIPVEHLTQLKEVVEAQDYVLLSDVLTYEFPEAINAWRSAIGALREQA